MALQGHGFEDTQLISSRWCHNYGAKLAVDDGAHKQVISKYKQMLKLSNQQLARKEKERDRARGRDREWERNGSISILSHLIISEV